MSFCLLHHAVMCIMDSIILGKLIGMDAILKIRLTDDDKILCGPGTEMLFDAIEQTGSVRRAAEKTGMSYTKAWKIIHDAEDAAAKVLIQRNPGGRDGGGAYLTDDAKKLMATYKDICSKIEKAKARIIKDAGL